MWEHVIFGCSFFFQNGNLQRWLKHVCSSQSKSHVPVAFANLIYKQEGFKEDTVHPEERH